MAQRHPRIIQQLKDYLLQEQEKIPTSTLTRLVSSMMCHPIIVLLRLSTKKVTSFLGNKLERKFFTFAVQGDKLALFIIVLILISSYFFCERTSLTMYYNIFKTTQLSNSLSLHSILAYNQIKSNQDKAFNVFSDHLSQMKIQLFCANLCGFKDFFIFMQHLAFYIIQSQTQQNYEVHDVETA